MHTIITGCSRVIFMDLTVRHKQIEEKWRQQIVVEAEHLVKESAKGSPKRFAYLCQHCLIALSKSF